MTMIISGDFGVRHARFDAKCALEMHVCISETQPCMLSQEFTILLFQFCAIPLFTILLFTTLLYKLLYHDPSRLHLGNPPVPVEPGFYNFTISVRYCTIPLFTVLLFTTLRFTFILFYHGPSRLHLGNPPVPVEPGFTVFLFQYGIVLKHYLLFSYLLLYYLPFITTTASRSHLGNPTLHVQPGSCDFATSLFQYCTIPLFIV